MKLSTHLPKKALADLLPSLLSEPKAKYPVIGIIDVALLTKNTDTEQVEPTIRFLELKHDKDRKIPTQGKLFDTEVGDDDDDVATAEVVLYEPDED